MPPVKKEWRDPSQSSSPLEEERSAARSPLLPAPSLFSNQLHADGEQPSPFSRVQGRGEAPLADACSSSSGRRLRVLCCAAAAELCSCRRERSHAGLCSAGTVEWGYLGPNLSQTVSFFKGRTFCEANVCDLRQTTRVSFLEGKMQLQINATPSADGLVCVSISDARCTDTSMLSRVPRPLI